MIQRSQLVWWYVWWLTVASTGCYSPVSDVSTVSSSSSRSSDRHVRVTSGRSRPGVPEQGPVRTMPARRSAAQAGEDLYSADAATDRVLRILQDSVDFAPTLVVWLLDVSPSAMQWGSEMRADIRQFYEQSAPALVAEQPDRLQTAVVTFGKEVAFPLAATADPAKVIDALEGLRADTSGHEVTFEAIRQALREYLPLRIDDRRELMLVVVTDEAGDDWQLVDQLIAEPRRYAVPVYVVGVPAPFGRVAAVDESVESPAAKPRAVESTDSEYGWQPVLQGPESRYLEMIRLELEDIGSELEVIDSGFGPFALEWLCRASGGSFLAVREITAGSFSSRTRHPVWPTPDSGQYDPQVMRRYAPDRLDESGYQALLQSNQASMALHQAARLPSAAVLRNPELRFERQSEAALKQRLDKAQQAAAKVAPAVDQLYDILRNGTGDAEKLSSPRWRAGFDLAFGRACAAKARIDGYNSMLAALKRGRTFDHPDSTAWVLVRSDSTETNSSLQNLITRATTHLQRVVTQHPGTPWARIAQYELETPMGWRWTEER